MAPVATHMKASATAARRRPLSAFGQSQQASAATHVAVADDARYEYFVREDNTACITRCVSSSKSIEIPACIDGWEVAELGSDSFANLFSAEFIQCPGCMRRIGDRAFSGCHTLRELHLNEGLQHIGSNACANCMHLSSIMLPSSVETMGCGIVGCATGKWRSFNRTNVTIAPENQHLFIDSNLVVYAREEQGLALLDGSSFPGGELRVLPGTYRINASAFASHGDLTSVVLPEGFMELGEACFSGCYNLTKMNFPSTLVAWGENALASTRVARVHIPAACIDVNERSFNFGPSDESLYGRRYAGAIERITVDPDHPFLTMKDSLLCARISPVGEEEYLGLLCESNVHELIIPTSVKGLSVAALSGLAQCGMLRIHEGLHVANSAGLLPNGKVTRLVIDLAAPVNGESQVSLEMPEGMLSNALSVGSLTAPRLDTHAFLQAYDATIAAEQDDLSRARHYIARLVSSVYLDRAVEETTRSWLVQNMFNVCIHFGARNYWDGFSQLVECGLLNEETISSVVEVLSGFNDTAAVAYLLQLKHTHFAKASWDYDL